MKYRRTSRFLSIVLLIAMVLTLMPTVALAEEETEWQLVTEASQIKTDGTTRYAIIGVDPETEETFALSGNTSKTASTQVYLTGGSILFESNQDIKTNDDYVWLRESNTKLRTLTSGSGVNLSTSLTMNSQGSKIAIENIDPETGFLNLYTNGTNKYALSYVTDVGFKMTKGSTSSDNTIRMYVLVNSGEQPEDPPVVEISTIAEALAAENGDFTVKGVVTLLDGKNIYLQDATGAICLYLSDTATDITLGDTLIGTGSRGTYRGMPQLSNATYEKSEGLTLTAKETTIGALTAADVCTYVKLTGLTVTEVYDNNGAYTAPNITVKDENDNSIQIYKAVIGKTDGAWDVAVDDVIDFTGAVGVNNTTLQLRNTLASEITVTSDAPAAPAAPTASVPAGEVEAGTVVTFSSATEGAAIFYSIDDGATWTEGSSYTVNEAVTLKVKAVLNGVDSQIASFAYTVKTVTPEPSYSTIAEALAGENGATFTVKGVVTLLDGNNIYVQDATGGICVRAKSKPSDLSLGDTIIGTGARAVYNGLPQLNNSTYEKSEGLTLTAKETTIGALTAADVCTYVKLTGLTVTEVYDNNGSYSTPNITVKDANDNSIQIYKAVVGKTDGAWDVAAGDVIDFTGAVGTYNTTLQLRNTLATEIVKHTEPETKTGLVTDLADLTDGSYVVIYNPGNSLAMTSETYNNWYLLGSNATITEGEVVEPAADQIWKVGVNDGVYTFTQGDKTVAAWLDGNYVELTSNGSYNEGTANGWSLDLCNAESNTFYMRSSSLTTNYGGSYIEVYKKKVNGVSDTLVFCGYSTSEEKLTEKAYGMQFYLVAAPETPDDPTPEEATYGLVDKDSLQTGDKVILFNAGYSKGVSTNVISSYYLAGMDLVPAENVITTDNAAVVWEVTVNADGTYTFTNGSNTLGGTQTTNESTGKTYNNINLSAPAASAWTAEAANTANAYYLYLGDLPSSKENGHIYMDWFDKYSEFSLNDYANPGTNSAYVFSFYKQGAEPVVEPEETGDLITSLDALDGKTVAIYSPGHKTAISSKPNGDWYLKANAATVENGKVKNFTEDFVWTARKNADGTYSFFAYGDETRSITVWPSGNYAELSLNVSAYPDNTWTLTPAKTSNCFYINSPTVSSSSGPAYIEAYVRNEAEVFSGYFTKPTSNKFVENEFALQFYLVDPADAIAAYDDGEWDGVLEKGSQYVLYNVAAESSIGLYRADEYAFDAIPTTVANGLADPGNSAYVFTVDTMGRYYSFKMNGKFLATNNEEELLLADPLEDGSAPENAKWYLTPKTGGYIIYNKDCTYNGTPVCIEYYSSVFSGWTFSTKNDLNIYLFNFYPVVEGTKIHDDMVQKPYVKFDSKDSRCIGQDYPVAFTLVDMAPEITEIRASFTVNGVETPVEDMEFLQSTKDGSFTLTHDLLDAQGKSSSFTFSVTVTNSYGISYTGTREIEVKDEPFFEQLSPAPNAQTEQDKRPVISAYVGNVGDDPVFTMTINDQNVTPTYDPETRILSYQPTADLADGRVTVVINVTRADGVEGEKSWSFTVGTSIYQTYFGQLHSHTTYSDGSGSLETALDYIGALPESANIQFVAFTDHSNYFDTTSAANPADALNDQSLMFEASRDRWNTYKGTIANFNNSHDALVAIGGFEMTWSGGPGHINTFASDGLVSRNNADLNNKTGDAGMKLYYETINKGNSLNQFNHPGTTFGNFTDFSYWDEATDDHMFLVEVGNGEGQIGAGGYYPSYEQYIMALDKGWHVAPTNNQDNHKGRWGNANDARDVVLAETLSEQAIYDAIRNLRVYATEDKNLVLNYTVNGEPMGTVFEEAPDTMDVSITMYDPDENDSITKVELVANSGTVAYTWTNAAELAEGALSAELSPDYGYYFVRVTQSDGDLAVTAPVWFGQGIRMGIETFTCATENPVVNQETTLTTKLYNKEASDVTVKSIIYTVNGSVVIGSDTTAHTVPANGTLEIPFAYTPDTAKRMTITATVVMVAGGVEYTYSKDLTISVRENDGPLPLTPIATVQAQTEAGFEYAIEGVVTSNASGYDKDTAFFDCIYVQDETAGICCFPVSGEYKIGDKVHIEGYTDFYQAEMELQVTSIEKIGETDPVQPIVVTAAQVNDRSYLGSLVTLKGTVDSFELENDLVQTIMVKDAAGNVARVFIDGYITTAEDVKDLTVGCRIEATGLSSYDNTWKDTEYFPRIRVRSRADIICTAAEDEPAAIIKSTTVMFDGTLHLRFSFLVPQEFLDLEGAYVSFEVKGEEVQRTLISEGSAGAGGVTMFYLPFMIPEFADDVTVKFHDADGTVLRIENSKGEDYTDRVIYSGKTYAERVMVNGKTEKDRQLAKSLYDYGTAAQIYFQYGDWEDLTVDSSVTAVTLEDMAAYAPKVTGTKPEGFTSGGMRLYFEGNNTLRISFKLDGTRPATDFSYTLDGKPVEVISKSAKECYFDIAGIPAVELGKMHEISISDGTNTYTLSMSALGYAYNQAKKDTVELQNLGKALYLYAMAAENFFSENGNA